MDIEVDPHIWLLEKQTIKKKKERKRKQKKSEYHNIREAQSDGCRDTELWKCAIDRSIIFLAPQLIHVPWRGGTEGKESFIKIFIWSCLVLHTVTPTISLRRPEMNKKVLFMSHYPPLPPSIAVPLTQGFGLRGKK